MRSPYLCVLYVATDGQHGPYLGANQKEIVLLIYVMIDVWQNKVVGYMKKYVKPNIKKGMADIKKEVLKESILIEYHVSTSVPLQMAIDYFDEYRKGFEIWPTKCRLYFITDGQFHLRQCLHPEAWRKNIKLPDYYGSFYDLRKEFKACYGMQDEPGSIKDMITYLGIRQNTETKSESKSEHFFTEVENMVIIIRQIIADGHEFTELEKINIGVMLGTDLKNQEVDDNCVVKVKGFTWGCSSKEVARFFRGLNIENGGVTMCRDPYSHMNGTAFVIFQNQEHRDMALKRHLHWFIYRYIEVYKATGKDFMNHAAAYNAVAQEFLSRGGKVILKLLGVPYNCTAKQVLDFFKIGKKSCKVMNGEDGVLLVKKPNGKATRFAFVLFAQEEDATKALRLHKSFIGSCYVRVFRSTPEELQHVLNGLLHHRS